MYSWYYEELYCVIVCLCRTVILSFTFPSILFNSSLFTAALNTVWTFS